MTEPQAKPLSAPHPAEPESISLLAVANVVLRHRFLVAATSLSLAVLVGVVLLIPSRIYTSESAFMLQVRTTIPSNLSGLASQFGFSLPAGEANQSPAFYAELLQSREVLGAVVDTPLAVQNGGEPRTLPLADWLRVRGSSPALRRDNTIKQLRKNVAVSTSAKTGVVTLKVASPSPELSAIISERMLTWLNEFNLRKRQSQASAERIFTEARLKEAEKELQDAENRLLTYTERNRVTTSPLLALEQERLARVVSVRQQVYTSVVQAYDRAKIDEVRDTPVITILQSAEEPIRPDSRGIVVRVLLTLIIGAGIGVLLASMRESLRPRTAIYETPLAEFAIHWAAVKDDLRHPTRTLGHLVWFGRRA